MKFEERFKGRISTIAKGGDLGKFIAVPKTWVKFSATHQRSNRYSLTRHLQADLNSSRYSTLQGSGNLSGRNTQRSALGHVSLTLPFRQNRLVQSIRRRTDSLYSKKFLPELTHQFSDCRRPKPEIGQFTKVHSY